MTSDRDWELNERETRERATGAVPAAPWNVTGSGDGSFEIQTVRGKSVAILSKVVGGVRTAWLLASSRELRNALANLVRDVEIGTVKPETLAQARAVLVKSRPREAAGWCEEHNVPLCGACRACPVTEHVNGACPA